MKLAGYFRIVVLMVPIMIFMSLWWSASMADSDQTGLDSNRTTDDYPRRGLSADKVQEKYGAPIERSRSVGEPPISFWIYNGFVVYFEGSYVITTVRDVDQLPSQLGAL